ncbi:MAG: acyl-CoA dehydrogenase family protein, partial [Gemmatimonadaceae bacterium]
YTSRWLGGFRSYGEFGHLAHHMRYIERITRRLGRSIFHAMVKLGPKLEKRQMVLFRAVDIGAELFAMSASCVRAVKVAADGDANAVDLADLFCRESRLRIADSFRMLFGPTDGALYRLSQRVMQGEFTWLERGIVAMESDQAEATDTSGELIGAAH